MLVVFIINTFLLTIAVLIHYEFLYHITSYLPKSDFRPRARILIGVFGALLAHVVEVWLFGAAYFFMNAHEAFGYLSGNFDGSWWDSIYFSFTVYTTVGFGDVEPHGHLRFLTGIESLVGLVLITWTASFLYLEMRRYWNML
jgi:hypothetical protein